MPTDLNPRTHSRYKAARAAWLAGYRGQPGTCHLCGGMVDTALSGKHPWGPTIEHTWPVRDIIATSRDMAEALDRTCDVRWWALAHRVCNDRQGAAARNAQLQSQLPSATMSNPSRVW